MNKTEKALLEHLKPATSFADTYFCSIAKNNKNHYMDTVADKIKKLGRKEWWYIPTDI